MLFKKRYVLLFLLLVVFLSIISVNASNELQYNETKVEYNINIINNINVSVDDKLSDNDEVVDTNITLSLQQGEHIELVFNQFKLINNHLPHYYINDNYISYDGNVSDDEMHDYIALSAIGGDAVNVGMNTLTVEYRGHPSIVEKVASNLIQFKTMDLNETQDYEDYSYKFNLNISKKQEKTIHIMNKSITYCFYGDNDVFYKLRDIDKFSIKSGVQLILSKNEKIYYNTLIYYFEYIHDYYSFNLCNLFLHNIKIPTDFYDLTLVNYDGTNDTCIFELKKLSWDIGFGYNIMNDTVLFYFDAGSFIDSEVYSDYNMTLKIGNITKSIPSKNFDTWKISDWNVTVLFDELDDGFYDVVIEIPGNDYIEDFLYTTQIEIGNKSVIHDDNISEDTGENNVTNNTIISLNNTAGDFDGNSSILSQGNSDDENLLNFPGRNRREHSSDRRDDYFDEFNNERVSDYGDLELSGGIHSVDNIKSYEISEKSVSKSIDNLLIKLCLIIMFTISFMVGLVRFKKCPLIDQN